jgi:hypothetical protein
LPALNSTLSLFFRGRRCNASDMSLLSCYSSCLELRAKTTELRDIQQTAFLNTAWPSGPCIIAANISIVSSYIFHVLEVVERQFSALIFVSDTSRRNLAHFVRAYICIATSKSLFEHARKQAADHRSATNYKLKKQDLHRNQTCS